MPTGAAEEDPQYSVIWLGLKSLDQRAELETYGNWPRGDVCGRPSGVAAVVIYVHDKQEFDTPAFRKFVKEAVAAYERAIGSLCPPPVADVGRSLRAAAGLVAQYHPVIGRPEPVDPRPNFTLGSSAQRS